MIKETRYKYFSIASAGPNSIVISPGLLRIISPRNEKEISLPLGEFPISESGANQNRFRNEVVTPVVRIENIEEDCKVYLKVSPIVTFEALPVNFGTGAGDDTFTDPSLGVLIFANLMKKSYSVLGNPVTIVVQAEDPESTQHTAPKNFDSVVINGDGTVTATASTHILLAEITVGDSLYVRQRHRGPVTLIMPEIFYGDFGYRAAAL